MNNSERNKLTPELLKQIANKLGDNWRYHQILSDETNRLLAFTHLAYENLELL